VTIGLSGLVSGLDTDTLVRQLMDIERRPLAAVQLRINVADARKSALQDLATRLLAVRTAAQTLASEALFRTTSVRSSNESVLGASGTSASSIGSYVFTVLQTAQAHQLISTGMADADITPVGAGSLSIELGDAFVDRVTSLGMLNGGTGVERGSIRITDRSGDSATIDLSGATTAADVIELINDAMGVRVTASVSGGSIVLTDNTGSISTNLLVEEVGGDTTASDLGILGDGGGTGTITGSDVMYATGSTQLSVLNDGNGISTVEGLNDFRVTLSDGSSVDVDLTGAATVSDVLDAINNDSENTGDLTASLTADGKGIRLVDTSGGGGDFSVTGLNSSVAAADLGILQTVSSGTITGEDLVGGLNTVLLRSLNGGSGVGVGTISITDRGGSTSQIDLSGAQTLQDVIELINADGAVDVIASVGGTGNSLLITDQTGLTASNLIIEDVDATAAADLGIDTGSGGVASTSVRGEDLELQYINEGTLLSELNGGRGVVAGKFKMVDRAGTEAIIDLTQPDDVSIADILEEINGSAVMVTATINATGDGILLTDTSGGTGTLVVEEYENGTTAADLNILGSASAASPGIIDGSFEYEIEVSATDTLEDVAEMINDLGIRVGAAVFNDGSGVSSYHLSITSEMTGSTGRILIDPGDIPLDFSTTSEARDAVLLLGSLSAGNPIAITSDSNVISDVIPGMTLNVVSASSIPVTISVTRDNSAVVNAVDNFLDQFNLAVDAIESATSFDADTTQRGILFGDSTAAQIRRSLYNLVTEPLDDAPPGYNTLASIGIGLDDTGHLTAEAGTLLQKMESNLSGVVALLSGTERVVTGTTLVEDLRGGEGIRTVDGQDDIRITLRDGTTLDVDLSDIVIVQNILSAINDHVDNGGKLVAQISSGGDSIELVDLSTPDGVSELGVTMLNGSLACSDLGLRMDRAAAENVYGGASLDYRSEGIASLIIERLDFLADESEGTIRRKTDGIDRIIDLYDDQMDTLQRRLDATEDRLYRQFLQMEMALAQLQSMQLYVSLIKPITLGNFGSSKEGGVGGGGTLGGG